MLTLLGCGVVANAVLAKNKGFNGGFLMINIGWGFAVIRRCVRRLQERRTPQPGRHVRHPGRRRVDPRVDVDFDNMIAYLIGEFAGAFIGAVLCWLAYRDHFDDPESEPGAKLGTFSTGPAIRNTVSNLVTEIIGTFVLVFVILSLRQDPAVASARWLSPCSLSVSVPPSVVRRDTPSTRPVTSGRVSHTRSCRSRARATATGATPGSRSSARSSVASSAGVLANIGQLSSDRTRDYLWLTTSQQSTKAPRAPGA